MIFLAGIKHCGKTTLGRMCAQALNRPFYDLDDLIRESLEKDFPGRYASLRDFYRREGKEAFQNREAAALRSLLQDIPQDRQDSPSAPGSALTALGGGTLENPAARELCRQGTVIYLRESPEILYRRILQNGLPPFLEGPDPQALFNDLYQRRDPLCREAADTELPLKGAPISQAAQLLQETLKQAENHPKETSP